MMISMTWLFYICMAELLACLVVAWWMERIAYRQGIWDGAFNHFLPVVREQMLYYDEHRAKQIFLDDEEFGNRVIARMLAREQKEDDK